jgi:arylsulfatase
MHWTHCSGDGKVPEAAPGLSWIRVRRVSIEGKRGDQIMQTKTIRLAAAALVGALATFAGVAEAQARKPNILVIWGDDIGQFNISAYNNGMMGYRTPNIDSIAREGAIFTDWYGQQSCTAGRAAFITGQSPIRTGLTKVGLPGAPEGMRKEDPTIATLL